MNVLLSLLLLIKKEDFGILTRDYGFLSLKQRLYIFRFVVLYHVIFFSSLYSSILLCFFAVILVIIISVIDW